jgi:hypothetical protein
MTVTYPILPLLDGEELDPAWFADVTEAVNDHETRLSVVETLATRIIRKTADQSHSSTVVTTDTHLVAGMEASANYAFEINLFVSAGASVDYKVGLTWPALATVSWMAVGYYVLGTNFEAQLSTSAYQAASGTTLAYGGGSDYPTLFLRGFARCGATAGNLQLQWAPNSAGTATVKQDSWMRIEKVIA